MVYCIVNFEQVNAGWDIYIYTKYIYITRYIYIHKRQRKAEITENQREREIAKPKQIKKKNGFIST